MFRLVFASLLLSSTFGPAAHAYIGPGVGVGVIAVVIGILGAIFLAFVAILWYPFKRLVTACRRTRAKAKVSNVPGR